MPDDRELALLIWAVVLISIGLLRSDIRGGVLGVGGALLQPKILAALLMLVTYVVVVVLVASRVGLWGPEFLTATVLWFVATGFVLFLRVPQAAQPGFFRRAAIQTVEVGVLVTVYVNLVTLPLVLELVLLPVATILVLVAAVAARDPEAHQVKRLAEALLAGLGLALLAFTTLSLLGGLDQTDWSHKGRSILLPIWLTLALLPFLWLLALVAAYETAFLRVDLASEDRQARRRAKAAIVLEARFRLRAVRAFDGSGAPGVVSASSLREGMRLARSRITEARSAESAANTGDTPRA